MQDLNTERPSTLVSYFQWSLETNYWRAVIIEYFPFDDQSYLK